MKKLLLMAFVSVAMLAAVSCSKDDEKETASLVGTEWECSESFTVMTIEASFSANVVFNTETMCTFSGNINAGALLNQDMPSRETAYTFDGKKVRFSVEELNSLLGTDEIVLDYDDNLRTMSFTLPSEASSLLGFDKLVFHRVK